MFYFLHNLVQFGCYAKEHDYLSPVFFENDSKTGVIVLYRYFRKMLGCQVRFPLNIKLNEISMLHSDICKPRLVF